MARFTRILGTLLQSGVPMLGALAVVKDMMANQVLAARRGPPGRRRQGAAPASPSRWTSSGVFPPLAIHMVRVGEETGRLEEMLLKVAADLRDRHAQARQAAHRPAEPGIILVMGLVVGFIVVAMLMAILSITDLPL